MNKKLRRLYRKITVDFDGWTVRTKTLELFNPPDGYQVGGASESEMMRVHNISYNTFEDVMYELKAQKPKFIGAWVDENQSVWIEGCNYYKSKTKALAIGAERGEIAIWDWKHQKEIKVPLNVKKEVTKEYE